MRHGESELFGAAVDPAKGGKMKKLVKTAAVALSLAALLSSCTLRKLDGASGTEDLSNHTESVVTAPRRIQTEYPGARRRQRRRRKAPERRMSIPLRILWSPSPNRTWNPHLCRSPIPIPIPI